MQGGAAIPGLSPIVIPVFVSNLGCRHRCIFCDQRQFSEPVPPEEIPSVVQSFLSGCRNAGEKTRLLAFYGGSFTGIESSLFESYLAQAKELVKEGVIHGIKASTRPDMVTEELIDRCREAGFVEMEIGVQSMDEAVLCASGRGHGTDDTVRAAQIVRGSGLKLGVQLMPGLPGEDRESFKRTVEAAVRLKPDGVRIYPTVVFAGTVLEKLYNDGSYRPIDLEEAVLRCLYGFIRFTGEGCAVLRMGLPPSGNMRIIAGPYHESFGFLVRAKAYRIMAGILMEKAGGPLEFSVHPDDIPELLGYKRENIRDLGFSYSFNKQLPRGTVEYFEWNGVAERGCLQPKDIIEYIL